ncbi:helix-turn-helix transcriptional regulator [Streptomyces sp. AM 2-1-1]
MTEPADVDEESGRAALGRTLRYLREKAGRSLGQLAEETRYDKSYLYRLEVSQRLSKLEVMQDLDRY